MEYKFKAGDKIVRTSGDFGSVEKGDFCEVAGYTTGGSLLLKGTDVWFFDDSFFELVEEVKMKQVVLEAINITVTPSQATVNKIYACIDPRNMYIYKAHFIGNSHAYAFVRLNRSDMWANGSHDSLELLLDRSVKGGFEVYEFVCQRDFAEWLLKNS